MTVLALAVVAGGVAYFALKPVPDQFGQAIPATITDTHAMFRRCAWENCDLIANKPIPQGAQVTITSTLKSPYDGGQTRWNGISIQMADGTHLPAGYIMEGQATPNADPANPPPSQPVTYADMGITNHSLNLTKSATIVGDVVVRRNDGSEVARMHNGEPITILSGPFPMPIFNTALPGRPDPKLHGVHQGDGQTVYNYVYQIDTGMKRNDGSPITGFVSRGALKQFPAP